MYSTIEHFSDNKVTLFYSIKVLYLISKHLHHIFFSVLKLRHMSMRYAQGLLLSCNILQPY